MTDYELWNAWAAKFNEQSIKRNVFADYILPFLAITATLGMFVLVAVVLNAV